MTEEEEKKQEQQAATATQQPDAVEQSIKNLEDRAEKKREFANSPISIDTSGQTDWMAKLEQVRREYTESPEQQAAREKRERRNRRIAAISDGLVALSNVAGAMAGATAIKQAVTLSDAHRKAVERAAQRRRENAARYETARRYLSGLQQQQDKLNADKYDKAVKARQDAGKEADALEGTAARLRLGRENARRSNELAKQRAEEQKRHNRASEGIARARAAKGGKGDGGADGNGNDYNAAYNYWESLTPAEQQQYRQMNNRIGTEPSYDVNTKKWVYKDKADDKNFIMHVWEQRKGWLRTHGRSDEISSGGYNLSRNGGKKKVNGFGSSQSSGKKKIAGFGN